MIDLNLKGTMLMSNELLNIFYTIYSLSLKFVFISKENLSIEKIKKISVQVSKARKYFFDALAFCATSQCIGIFTLCQNQFKGDVYIC